MVCEQVLFERESRTQGIISPSALRETDSWARSADEILFQLNIFPSDTLWSVRGSGIRPDVEVIQLAPLIETLVERLY